MADVKKEGYFIMKDAGAVLHDASQDITISGKVPAKMKLTKLVRQALAGNAIEEISEKQFLTLLKELKMEFKDGVVTVKSDDLTEKQQEVLDDALKLKIIKKRNTSFYMGDERIAGGINGLVKKLKNRSFSAKLRKAVEIEVAAEDEKEDTVKTTEASNKATGQDDVNNTVDLAALLLDALDKSKVTKDGDVYMFGEFALGSNDEEVLEFLGKEENNDITLALQAATKESE